MWERKKRPFAIYLIKFFFHQVPETAAFHPSGFGRAGRSPESYEALVRAVPQQSHQGIRLLGLHSLETGEGGDVPGRCPEAHQVFAVLVMHQLLLGDFFHLFSQTLDRAKEGKTQSLLLTRSFYPVHRKSAEQVTCPTLTSNYLQR